MPCASSHSDARTCWRCTSDVTRSSGCGCIGVGATTIPRLLPRSSRSRSRRSPMFDIGPARILILSPNWLGDAVMALPAIADIRRAFPSARVVVAGRRVVADMFRLVPAVDEIVTLQWSGSWWQRGTFSADVKRLRALRADLAVLLPNSFASAWLVKRAGMPDRWGYAADMRTSL